MNSYEEKLKQYLHDCKSTAEHLTFPQPCRSVAEAALAAKAAPEDFIKSIVFVHKNKPVIALVRGIHKADPKKVGAYLGDEVPIASPSEVLTLTGYPAGGVPPIGYEATFLIDPAVMQQEAVIAGGGSEYALLKITTEEIQRFTNGEVVEVKK